MAAARMIAAHERSKLKYAACWAMYWPRLDRGAPKYSPTIAPIVASVAGHLERGEDVRQRGRDAHLAQHGELGRGRRAHQLQRRRVNRWSGRAPC